MDISFVIKELLDLYERCMRAYFERDGESPHVIIDCMEYLMNVESMLSDIADKADKDHIHSGYALSSHSHVEDHVHQNILYLNNIDQNVSKTSRPQFYGIRSTDYTLSFGGKPNNNAIVVVTPEGTATQSEIVIYNKSDWANSSRLRIIVNQSAITIDSSKTGSGELKDIVFSFNATEVVRITTGGIIMAKGFQTT